MAFAQPKKRDPAGEAGLFEYAVGLLARRMRTVRELRRLMQRRAFPGDQGERDMDAVVLRLVELKYLSDERFAADYTRLRKENQSLGRRRVQQDLAVKGISRDLAASALASVFDGADEVELARQYCARKRIAPPTGPDAAKETARLMNRLLRAGYSPGAIFKLLRGWNVPDEAIPEEDAVASLDSYGDGAAHG
jgi:regulatory protein